MGCEVITKEETGLKIVVRESEIVLLHLTSTGDAFGSAHLDPANTRRLIDETRNMARGGASVWTWLTSFVFSIATRKIARVLSRF